MAELLVHGSKPDQRFRRQVPPDTPLIVGRDCGDLSVPWDPFISRQHARLQWSKGSLRVERLPAAANPVFYQGQEAVEFSLRPGDHFVIGETTFTLAEDHATPAATEPPPVQERAVSSQELQGIPFRNAPHQIDVLSRLPDVISGAANDQELFLRLGNMLLAGVSRADAVAVVAIDALAQDNAPVKTLYSDRRLAIKGADFRPSQRLIRQALQQQQTVVHAWQAGTDPQEATFTAQGNFDWAFCTPVCGEACQGWGIYLAGRFAGDASSTLLAPWENSDLGDDLKFTELVASILSSLRQVQLLQRKQAVLSPFFSPAVLRTFAGADPEAVLKPRETEVTVLFCDLRGFSRHSEKQADHLMLLLERVSKALGVMTQNILDQGGVIADFQGDAALGFWGWPLAQPDKVRRACLAALDIRRMFEAAAREPGHPLADFRVGIGLATGPAVAGKIGTTDQAKVGVFGPVVNLASRLQGMTKLLHADILLDEETARMAAERLPHELGRCRRLLKVKPYGMDTALLVSELLPAGTTYPGLADEQVKLYEGALDAFLEGKWTRAYELLHMVPPHDRGKDVLTSYIIQHEHTPPAGWSGVIPLESKS
jgi:adenylate cyclase